MAEPAPVPVQRPDFGPSLFAGLACLLDILLVRAWLLGQINMVEGIFYHSSVALALGGMALLFRRRFSQSILVGVIILILFGPLGGPALMIVGPAVTASRQNAFAVAMKAKPQTPTTGRAADLFNQIRQGRRHPLPQEAPRSFLETFKTGTLHQQQEAIAAISRNYRPDMRPALSAALASPVPALRVQAAAVYAKLRGTYEARAKELLSEGKADGLAANPDLAAECLSVSQSGFVSADIQKSLQGLSARSAPPATAYIPFKRFDLHPSRLRPALEPTPRLKRYACGGLG